MGDFKVMGLLKTGSTHCSSPSEISEKHCPICGNPNRCGKKEVINGIELNRCWCAYETFPKAIFEIVPDALNGKSCICQQCLYQFKQDNHDRLKLRKIISEFVNTWQNDPTTSWTQIYTIGETLLEWKTQNNINGLWDITPIMMTATIDDAIGQGLKMIHLFSCLAGIDIISLGLMQSKETIIERCQKQHADFLGMTILQFDTESVLNTIIPKIPEKMCVLVGGPIFKTIPKKELHEKKYVPFNNICDYLTFLLNLEWKES